MKIIVAGLTYNSPFPDVQVGDVVELPPTGYGRYENWQGVVEALGSDYDGYLKNIIRVLGTPREIAERRVEALEDELIDVGKRLAKARATLQKLSAGNGA